MQVRYPDQSAELSSSGQALETWEEQACRVFFSGKGADVPNQPVSSHWCQTPNLRLSANHSQVSVELDRPAAHHAEQSVTVRHACLPREVFVADTPSLQFLYVS